MQLQLVAIVLFVGCMLAPSLAMAGEEGEAKAVLQVIRMLLASENHGRSELQQAGGYCQVEDSKKVSCGFVGITQTQCEDECCCWSQSSASGVPQCFQKIETASQCQTSNRVDCGFVGIPKAACWSRGCCYSPTTASGQPWCYHQNTTAAAKVPKRPRYLASQQTSSDPRCEMGDAEKVRCGNLGISETHCLQTCCCWRASNVSGVPSCWQKKELAPQCQANQRVECGYIGINKLQCWMRGCCYNPTTGKKPWCYHEEATAPECQTAPASRVECGHLGINGTQCKKNGCCWSPTSVSGAPWCFIKSTGSTAASKFAYFGKQKFQRS